MEIFAERLKELRIENNLTIVQLATETKLSKSSISYWENNERVPSALNVITLAKFFGVSADFLLGLEN